MLGRFAVRLFLFLLAKEFKSTDGYAVPIRKGEFVTACVSDETPVAFVKDFQVENDDTTVDVVDLNGNAIPLADLDCNLVREGGCEKWNLKGWEKQRNMRGSYDPFPMVTDYRWNDLPGFFANEKFQKKIKIMKNQNFKMYFSILAHNSAQFLFTNDSTLDSGWSIVVDGWESAHKSLIRYCFEINNTLINNYDNGDLWRRCREYQNEEVRDVLKEGRKWAHVTLEITFDEDDTSNSLILGENIYIKFSARSKKMHGSDFFVSFRSSKIKRGLFKSHDYSIIRPVKAPSSMEVQLEEDSTSSFCVDVVFLTNERITSGNKIISAGVLNATGSNIFDKTVQSAGNYLKWTTVRFGAGHITPKKGWKIKLTAHDKSLVIGGVKFCKEGDLVTKTKMRNVANCYPLVKRPENKAPDKYNQLLNQLGKCKAFGGYCDGYKLCYTQHDCKCFAGYQGRTCNSCTGRNFGKDCSETSRRFCFDERFSNIDGTCLQGCVSGYLFPDCLKECTGKRFGLNCNEISHRNCLDDKHFPQNGSCRLGCAKGYFFPECKKSCTGRKYGKNCLETSHRFCFDEKFSNVDGTCLQGCVSGYLYPECLAECTGKRFGPNCSEISHRTCMNDTHFPQNGSCRLGCAEGYIFPQCETTNNLSNVMIATLIIVPLIFALLALIGTWIYFKKCRKPEQTSHEATVQFSEALETCTADSAPLFEENHGDEPIYDEPFNASQVEKYLQSAFIKNFLDEQFKKFPRGQTQPWEVGTKPENKKKNRYNNLAAYDSSRVKLDLLPGDENSDYINANYIDGFERPKAYIASQGPMASTVDDFWRMVWQEQVSLIVMLTNLTEGGKVKCEKYWPDADQEAKFGRLTVRNMREEINADYVTRDLLVTRENTKKIVQQLHYTNWPNHGVPLYPQSIAIFREKFTHRNELAPILVHCSAGVGRTGTVILIDACLKMVRSCGQLDVVNIFSQMRKQRANLVDTLEQFEFVHLVLLESILNPKFEINCENFPEEYKHLTSKDNQKINESFELLTEICNKDFQRGDKPAEFEANKCRYPDIISTSSAIVSLFPYGDVTTMNFINAVFVDGYKRAKQFIVTQVPMKNTVWDFWRMIDQFNVKQIIILNESHHSYGDFLPTKQRKLDFDEIEVILDDIDDGKLLKTYEITLDTRGICKKVCVKYASLGWKSEADAPPNLESVIELWEDLKISGGKDIVTIACHDGVTASGLFLAIGFVIEKIKMEQKVDVGLAVRTLRKAKPVFISSGMQFGLLYKAAKFYLSSFETYNNFK